jgi:hypothetical protein
VPWVGYTNKKAAHFYSAFEGLVAGVGFEPMTLMRYLME